MATERKSARFKLQRTLRSCNLYTTSKALDEAKGTPVLTRRFAPHLFETDAEWRQFRDILRSVAQQSFPGVLAVQQIGGALRQPWLIVSGAIGNSIAERTATMTPKEVLRVWEKLAEVVAGLHAVGHVHGRIQSDAVYFTSDGSPCLDEFASTWALCGWDAASREIPGEFIGELFSPASLAPEIRNGGLATPHTDQYALAILLLECVTGQSSSAADAILDGVRKADLSKPQRTLFLALRPALERALHPDPLQRFPNCVEFLAAVRTLRQRQVCRGRLMTQAIAAAVIVPLVVLGGWFGRAAMAQLRTEREKQQLRSKVAAQYQFALTHISSVPMSPAYASLHQDPNSTEAVLRLTRQPAMTVPTKIALLKDGIKPAARLICTSRRSTETTGVTRPALAEDLASIFLISNGEVVRLDDLQWSTQVQLPAGIETAQAFISADLVNQNGQSISEPSAQLRLSPSQTQPTLWGRPPNTRLKADDVIRARVLVHQSGTTAEWTRSSNEYYVGVIERHVKSMPLGSVKVAEGRYVVDSGVVVGPNDEVRIEVTGTAPLGDVETYRGLGYATSSPIRIPAEGLTAEPADKESLSRRHLWERVSKDRNHKYGAVLVKFGDESWQPTGNDYRHTTNTTSKLLFSLNGIISKRGQPLDPTELSQFWSSSSAFYTVTITVQMSRLPSRISQTARDKIKAQTSF